MRKNGGKIRRNWHGDDGGNGVLCGRILRPGHVGGQRAWIEATVVADITAPFEFLIWLISSFQLACYL